MNDTRLLQQFLDDLPADIPRPPMNLNLSHTRPECIRVKWYADAANCMVVFVDNGVVFCTTSYEAPWRFPAKDSGSPYEAVLKRIRSMVTCVKEPCSLNGMVALNIEDLNATTHTAQRATH